MRISRIELMTLRKNCGADSSSQLVDAIALHCLEATAHKGVWPHVNVELRDGLKAVRDATPKGVCAYDRCMDFCAAARDSGSTYWRHVLLWESLPESVRHVFRFGRLSFTDLQNMEGEIDKEAVAIGLWQLANFYAGKLQQLAMVFDLAGSIAMSKHEYFPVLRAITDLGITVTAEMVDGVDAGRESA